MSNSIEFSQTIKKIIQQIFAKTYFKKTMLRFSA